MATAEVLEFRPACDPRALVRDCVNDNLDADPQAVAERLLKECDAEQLRALLQPALPRFVANVMRDMRRGAGVNPLPGSVPKGTRPASKKWNQAAEIFERQEAVGWGADYKKFGDFTVQDLFVTAAKRRTLANSNARAAKNYNALGQLMRERGVSVVRELPPMTVRDIVNA